MRNLFYFACLVFFVTFLVACVGVSIDDDSSELPVTHQWAPAEIEMLKSLWIGSLKSKADASNRVVGNPDAITLGHKLFFNTRFSANGEIACATCHKPDLYFTDGLAQAQGIARLKRNAPTVVGASQHNWFFLDGRTDSLWAQALQPIENVAEHGSSRNQLAHEIYKDASLKELYEKVFGVMPDISDLDRFPYIAGPIPANKTAFASWRRMAREDQASITTIFVNSAKAISAYETQLQPAVSRYDQYVSALVDRKYARLPGILSPEEISGLKLFIGKANCAICHNGPMFTDFGFHNIATPPLNVSRYDFGRRKAISRVKNSPFNCRSKYNDAKTQHCDELKYMVIDEHETMAAFKTPGLRNVSKTAPYMHAGQYATLSEVIAHYADIPETKVGMNDLMKIQLNETEQRQLELFLQTLDSDINIADGRLLKSPD